MGEQTKIKISTPADVLDAVPFFIGAQPVESLVALVIDGTGKTMTARFDLPATVPMFSHTLDYLRQIAGRYTATTVLLVAYTARAQLGDHVLLFIRDNWHHDTAAVAMTISANPDGWALVTDTADAQRQPYQTGTLIPAEMVGAGYPAPEGDQEQRRARYSRTPAADDTAALAQALAPQQARAAKLSTEQRSREVTDYMDRWTHQQGTLGVSDAAYLVGTIGDSIAVRDAALLHLETGNAWQQAALWEYVAGHVDGTAALPVLAIWTVAAWLTGDGLAANGILDRATATPGNEEYPILRLIGTALAAAMPPSAWDAMREALT